MLRTPFMPSCLLVAGLLAVGTTPAVAFNTIEVTTTEDTMAADGACSLREALHNANTGGQFSADPGECVAGSHAQPNRIVLKDGQTYALNKVGEGDDEGDLDVYPPQVPPEQLTLRVETENGETQAVIVQSVDNERVLQNHGAWIELDNVVLRNGALLLDSGGGIYNAGKMTLTRVTVMNNSAISGGGIYNAAGGELVLLDSSLEINGGFVGEGGGLFNEVTATAILSDVFLRVNSSGVGGGILNRGTLQLSQGSILSGNVAHQGNGGGISSDGDLYVIDTSFSGNQSMLGAGGAIHYDGPDELYIYNSQFQSNEGDQGGAIHIAGQNKLYIENCFFENNISANRGGAILSSWHMEATFSSFVNNTAGGGGGAISSDGVILATGSTFAGNTAENSRGGGTHSSGLAAVDSDFSGNVAGIEGGGAYAWGGVHFVDSRFVDNEAFTRGGALYISNEDDLEEPNRVVRSLFSGNFANQEGGALWVHGLTTTVIANSTISGNNVQGIGGGGVYLHAEADAVAINVTFFGDQGFPIINKQGTLELQNSIIAGPGPNCMMAQDNPIVSLGNNISSDDSCIGLAELSDDKIDTDPQLGVLANHGGNTLTHALLPGSPAIDMGNDEACAGWLIDGVDQRGGQRPLVGCDIGAFELEAAVAQDIFSDGFESP